MPNTGTSGRLYKNNIYCRPERVPAHGVGVEALLLQPVLCQLQSLLSEKDPPSTSHEVAQYLSDGRSPS